MPFEILAESTVSRERERDHVYVYHDIISLDDYLRNIATVTYNMAYNRCKIYYVAINGY